MQECKKCLLCESQKPQSASITHNMSTFAGFHVDICSLGFLICISTFVPLVLTTLHLMALILLLQSFLFNFI